MTKISSSKIAKSSLWVTASFVFAKLLQLASQVVLARLLSPKEFGIWSMVLIITTLSELFKDSAIAQVLIQRGLDDRTRANAVYSLGINISILMFFAQACVGYPLALFFTQPVVFPLTVCVAAVFLIGAGAGSHGAVLARRMQFRELAIAETGAGIARFAGAVIGAGLGLGVWSFAIAEITRAIADALLKRWFSRYPFSYQWSPDKTAIDDVKSYIGSLLGINLAVYANTNGDNLIVGRFLGAEALGYYGIAYQLAMLPAFALSQINRINFSVLSQQDREDQKQYLHQLLELFALLSAPIYGIALVIAPWLIPMLYGQTWSAAVLPFQIILVFAYSRGFMGILGTALNALDKPNLNAAINWVLVPISIPVFWIGANLGGIIGIAIAVALVMGIGATIWFWIATSRVIKCSILFLIQPIALPTTAAVLATFLALSMPTNSAIFLTLQPLMLMLIYGIVITIGSTGRIPRRVVTLIRKFCNF